MSPDVPQPAAPGQRARKHPRSITSALRSIVLPALHERGFTGELPHLRRVTPAGTSTFSLQVSKWGGEFIIELGRAPAGPYAANDGAMKGAAALTSPDLRLTHRARLRAVSGVPGEVWFRYGPRPMDRVRRALGRVFGLSPRTTSLERAAREVLALLPECDRWWGGEDLLPHVRSYAEQERAQWAGKWPPGPAGPPDAEG